MAKAPPMSDAERQKKRREKLKSQAAEEKYAPAPSIAEAVRSLLAAGYIAPVLLDQIRRTAKACARAAHPERSEVQHQYAALRIDDFFDADRKNENEDE